MNRRFFVLASLALGGCATSPPHPAPILPLPPAPAPGPGQAPALGPATYGELEPLYSAQAGRQALTIRVPSNGCTTKADFAFYVERRRDTVTLAFGRKRLDRCKSFAMGQAELTFTWEELGLAPRAPVVLLNPLTAWTGPGS
ncbi:MAG TPA: hypothetical protein VFW13_01935 [Phenylobacterium sp.]|nr:hypothetical protein [Phenylobacterium sp.]